MERTTTLVVDAAGTPVVRHVAPPGRGADALRREAVALAVARGLGVVELVEAVDRADGGAAIATRYVAGGTLADVARDGGELAAVAVLARVAGILARLHEAGIVHGRCTADHVVGTGAGVALCGLSGARLPGEAAPTGPDTDGFALLVRETCKADTDLGRRARRAVEGLAPSPPRTNLRVVASELAELAGIADVPGIGPGTAPGAAPQAPQAGHERLVEPRGSAPADTSPRFRATRTASPARRAAAVAAVAVGLGLLGGLALDGPKDRGGAGPGPAASSRDEVPVVGGGSATSAPVPDTAPDPPVQVWPGPEETAAPDTRGSATTAPAPGEGAAAGVVEHEGVRYQVGAAGDLVVVGDWDCDGVVTPGVVRPADGSVWTFSGWAADEEVILARPLGYAPSPVAATVTPSPDGCDQISVTTSEGREVVIDPG